MVNPAAPLQPHDSRLIGADRRPEGPRSVGTTWNEHPALPARLPGGPSVERTWSPTLSILDLLRHQVTGG